MSHQSTPYAFPGPPSLRAARKKRKSRPQKNAPGACELMVDLGQNLLGRQLVHQGHHLSAGPARRSNARGGTKGIATRSKDVEVTTRTSPSKPGRTNSRKVPPCNPFQQQDMLQQAVNRFQRPIDFSYHCYRVTVSLFSVLILPLPLRS